MKKVTLVFSLFAMSAFAGSWEGVISDAKCAEKHGGEKLNAGCVKSCIKGGQAAVFVTKDGKVHKIHNPDGLGGDENLGVSVKVDGKLDGDSLHVDKVEKL